MITMLQIETLVFVLLFRKNAGHSHSFLHTSNSEKTFEIFRLSKYYT